MKTAQTRGFATIGRNRVRREAVSCPNERAGVGARSPRRADARVRARARVPQAGCRAPNACLIRANSPCCAIHSAYAR